MGSILHKTLIARYGLTFLALMAVGMAAGKRAAAQVFATPLSNQYLQGSVGISGAANGINVAGRFVLTDNANPANSLLGPPGLGFYMSPQKTLGSYVVNEYHLHIDSYQGQGKLRSGGNRGDGGPGGNDRRAGRKWCQ